LFERAALDKFDHNDGGDYGCADGSSAGNDYDDDKFFCPAIAC
jgi:hypothetical protein